MTHLALTLSLVAAVLSNAGLIFWQDSELAIIEGCVYDPNDAMIPKVRIVLEDFSAGTLTDLKTDDEGHYKVAVKPGRYSLSQKPIVGFL